MRSGPLWMARGGCCRRGPSWIGRGFAGWRPRGGGCLLLGRVAPWPLVVCGLLSVRCSDQCSEGELAGPFGVYIAGLYRNVSGMEVDGCISDTEHLLWPAKFSGRRGSPVSAAAAVIEDLSGGLKKIYWSPVPWSLAIPPGCSAVVVESFTQLPMQDGGHYAAVHTYYSALLYGLLPSSMINECFRQ